MVDLAINKLKPGEYEIIKEGNEEVMRINYQGFDEAPSIADSAISMARTIDNITENPSIGRVVLLQRKNYIYDFQQTQLLVEIAEIYNLLTKQKKVLRLEALSTEKFKHLAPERFNILRYIILTLLKADPLGAYVELKRVIREEKIKLKQEKREDAVKDIEKHLEVLKHVFSLLEKTKLVQEAKQNLEGYVVGDRSLYKELFRPVVTPDFMLTRLMATPPIDGEEVDIYSLDKETNVTLFKQKRDIRPLYFLDPPEFNISEEKYELLDLARTVLSEHEPKEEEFLDPDKMRTTFYNIGRDLLIELAENKKVDISYEEIEQLAKILVRYTVGFGLVEVLLDDQRVQDIVINGPIGDTPIFLIHQDYDECVTNIIPSREDAESWATKFRLISGRPLDEANPVLDTELELPTSRARVAIVNKPLNPFGLAFAFRLHRGRPWTLPLFINNKMMNPLAAGLLSFLIDGSRTLLVAGTRSSGKTSVLGACMIEIMRKYRIVSVEDTLELPTAHMRKLGYNIQVLKVRSALTAGGTELSAEEGIRTSLRLGDSALIVGEVRSNEAKSLYEAMRVGALANVVAGTIHGDSPYGVFDRVVNDIGIPETSFKATDIIVIANPIKSPDGLQKWKRIISITEVRKHWEKDPMREKGFVDLMRYNPKTDQLEPTPDLINGDSEILKAIGGTVKEWAGNWDAIWDNIVLRAKVKETIVNYANKTKNPEIMEAEFIALSNDVFHKVSAEVRKETGKLESKKIFSLWEDWLKKETKGKKK